MFKDAVFVESDGGKILTTGLSSLKSCFTSVTCSLSLFNSSDITNFNKEKVSKTSSEKLFIKLPPLILEMKIRKIRIWFRFA